MDAVDYLRLLKRRWLFIVVPVVLAAVVAVVTTPASKQFASVKGYTATHTLLQRTDVTEAPNFDRLQLFATTGEVPVKAAKRLNSKVDPAILASRVQVVADGKIGSLTVAVSGADGNEDARIANAFAEEIKAFLLEQAKQERADAISAAQERVDAIAKQISAVQAQIAAGGNAVILGAQRDARTKQYSSAFSNLLDLQELPPPTSALETLQAATPVPTLTGGFSAPSSKRSRVLIGVLLALVLSLTVIVLLDRVDTRLRSRSVVEDVTKLPVLAEIPLLPREDRKASVLSMVDHPGAGAAEAFRTLRASLLLSQSSGTAPRVVLVTSPSSADGKTTTAVNLAAALAEAGNRVVVLDCDFRRPRAHQHLGTSAGRGLSDLVVSGDGQLSDVLRETRVPGVQLATAGTAPDHPAAVVARVGDLVQQARELADVVVIDCAPLLSVSDATDLVPHADAVLVVLRSGRSTTESARRTAERLARLGASTAGVAFVASTSAAAEAYYGYDDRDRRPAAPAARPAVAPASPAPEPPAPAPTPAPTSTPSEPSPPVVTTPPADPVPGAVGLFTVAPAGPVAPTAVPTTTVVPGGVLPPAQQPPKDLPSDLATWRPHTGASAPSLPPTPPREDS